MVLGARSSPAPPPVASASTALVTGASSGIGTALARALAERGHPLVLTARSASALEDLAAELPVAVRVVAADLATATGLDLVEQALVAADPPVSILVNNAGSAVHGPLVEQDARSLADAVAVNVLAPSRLTATGLRVLPAGGTVVIVSSTAAGGDAPGSAVYAAGKAYLESLSRTARRESGDVRVLVVRPGYTRTAFHERSGEDVTSVHPAWWQQPDDVARATLAALDAGEREITVVPPDPRGLPRRVAGHAWHAVRTRLPRRHRSR